MPDLKLKRKARTTAVATLLSLACAALLAACGGSGSGGDTSTASRSSSAPPTVNNKVHVDVHTSSGVLGDPLMSTELAPGASYAYQPVPEHATLWVQLDGKSIPASGTVTLDPAASHSLFVYVGIMPGDPAPEFKGSDASGQLYRLSALRGKWVLVEFGGWSCPGSRNFAPVLSSIYSQYHGRGLEVLSVLVNPNQEIRVAGPADLQAWSQTYGVNYPLIGDTDNATDWYNREYVTCTYYSCTDTPSIFLIDPQGTIAYRYRGWDPQAGLADVLAKVFP
jgi:peroxiredoxin